MIQGQVTEATFATSTTLLPTRRPILTHWETSELYKMILICIDDNTRDGAALGVAQTVHEKLIVYYDIYVHGIITCTAERVKTCYLATVRGTYKWDEIFLFSTYIIICYVLLTYMYI